ncbi:TPA: hypothetical protein ACIAHZ_004018 [Enterobacter roggenkampii]|uniref:hypothetical protein n=1 Tax=Enterobacter roggenkampii TaxID=1812935 RepID=UPI003785B9A8
MKQVTETELLARPEPWFETAGHGTPVAVLREDGPDVAIISKQLYDELMAFREQKLQGEFDEIYERHRDAFEELAKR